MTMSSPGFAGGAAADDFPPRVQFMGGMPNPGCQPGGTQPSNQGPLIVVFQPPSQPTQQSQAPSQASNSGVFKYTGTGVCKDQPGFDSRKGAESLRKAMRGFFTNERAIITVLTSCSNNQRQMIIFDYKKMYGKDLISKVNEKIKGYFGKVVLGLLQLPALFDAYQIKKALEEVVSHEAVLIEIFCSRNNQQIKEIRAAYQKEFKSDLEKDIESMKSGHFKKLLVSLVQGGRSESTATDTVKAKEDAKALYEAGVNRWPVDACRFKVIFASDSVPQLRLVFDEYAKLSKYSMEDTIEREMSDDPKTDLKKGLLTVVRCVENAPKYFAVELHNSKGLVNDQTLMRVMISRCEIDMVEIKEEFKRKYKQTLGHFISSETRRHSGYYKQILIELAGGMN